MTGVRPVGSMMGISDVLIEFNAGGTFAAQDFVAFDGSGEITVATAGNRILGVALEAGASGTDNVLVNITPYMMVIMDNDNDSDTFAATDVGLYGNFVGATGAMQVDTDTISSSVAQLLTLEYNPQGYGLDSDTSIGKFIVFERQVLEV